MATPFTIDIPVFRPRRPYTHSLKNYNNANLSHRRRSRVATDEPIALLAAAEFTPDTDTAADYTVARGPVRRVTPRQIAWHSVRLRWESRFTPAGRIRRD